MWESGNRAMSDRQFPIFNGTAIADLRFEIADPLPIANCQIKYCPIARFPHYQ
jgi:hypothetical protein